MDFEELVDERAEQLAEELGVPVTETWAMAEEQVRDELTERACHYSEMER